jgi:hypothetical protein
MLDVTQTPTLPARPGVGYKSRHFAGLTADPGPVRWIEIHAENYMGDGGRPLAQLAPSPNVSPSRSTASACPSAASARSTATTSPPAPPGRLAEPGEFLRTSRLVDP